MKPTWEGNLNRVESNPKTCQLTTWPRPGVERKLEQERFAHEHKTPFHSSPKSFTHLDKLPTKNWCFIYPSLTSPPPRGTRNYGLRLPPTLHRIGKVCGRELVEVELLLRVVRSPRSWRFLNGGGVKMKTDKGRDV